MSLLRGRRGEEVAGAVFLAEGLADVEVADVDFFLDVVLFLDVVFFEVEVAVTTGAVAGAEEEVEAVA